MTPESRYEYMKGPNNDAGAKVEDMEGDNNDAGVRVHSHTWSTHETQR